MAQRPAVVTMTAETPRAYFRTDPNPVPQYNRRTTRRNLHCAGCFTKWHSLCNTQPDLLSREGGRRDVPLYRVYGGPAPEQLGSVVRVSAPSEGKIAVVIRFALGMSESAASTSA